MTTKPAVEIDLDKQRAEFEAAYLVRLQDRYGRPLTEEESAVELVRNSHDERLYLHAESFWQGWLLARASQAVAEPVAIMQRFPDDQPASRVYTPVRPAWLGDMPPVGTKLYAAPVAQQSEAGASFSLVGKCVATGTAKIIIASAISTEWADRIVAAFASQPVEAGAPTAAAEQGQMVIGAGDPEAFFAQFCDREGYPSDGEMDAALRGAFYAGIEYCAVPVAPTSGRESAAPLAQQDAKDAARYRYLRENMKFIQDDRVTWMDLRELIPTDHHNVHTDWQEHLWDASVDVTVDAAMQKGASNG